MKLLLYLHDCSATFHTQSDHVALLYLGPINILKHPFHWALLGENDTEETSPLIPVRNTNLWSTTA